MDGWLVAIMKVRKISPLQGDGNKSFDFMFFKTYPVRKISPLQGDGN